MSKIQIGQAREVPQLFRYRADRIQGVYFDPGDAADGGVAAGADALDGGVEGVVVVDVGGVRGRAGAEVAADVP